MNVRSIVLVFAATVLLLSTTGEVLAEERRSQIIGTVWFDANANGKPDSQERAVRNVQIDLEGPNYRESRKTGDEGTYEFKNLPAGRFQIAIRLPAGYGLSAGEPQRELSIDGRSIYKFVDWGVARSDQLATTTPPPTSAVMPATSTPLATNGSSLQGHSSGSLGGPPVGAAPAAVEPRQGTAESSQAEPTATPEPTSTRMPTVTSLATSTITPTATRTPPAIEGQQASAERARAALGSPGLPRAESSRQNGDVLLDVPFRSAVDESDYADTNSGSAAVAMALEAYGFNVATGDLRSLANTLTRSYDVGQPPRIDVLVRVGEQAGLHGIGLFQGLRLAVWSVDDVRERVRLGFPVLTMIQPDDGDEEPGVSRFVLVIGTRGEDLVYHDPTFEDTAGARRMMSAKKLVQAWSNAPGSGQAAGLALGPQEVGLFASLDELKRAQNPERAAGAREVPTVAAPPIVAPLAQLAPAPVEERVLNIESSPAGGLPLHPLLMAFWMIAGLILLKIVARLVLD